MNVPPSGSGGGAVLAMLDVLDRDLEKPILKPENGLVIGDRFNLGRARIADNLGRIIVDPAIGHPRLRLNASEPVRQRWDTPLAILAHMLLADPADRDDPARAVGQAVAEVTFGLEDPERVVPMRTMRENREVLFG